MAVVPNTTYSINVEIGGLADFAWGGAPNGGNGRDSTFGNFAISHGGGDGRNVRVNVALLKGVSGGDGGGGSSVSGYASTTPGAAYPGEVNAGGLGTGLNNDYWSGGGGAGQVGQSSTPTGNAKGELLPIIQVVEVAKHTLKG